VIRVLSCNLFFGRANAAALNRTIAENEVDIVCAQEVSPDLAASLLNILPYGDVDRPGLKRDNGIVSRLPIELDVIDMPGRMGRVASLSPEHWPQLQHRLQIATVHIQAPQKWPWFPNPVRRRDQLAALLRYRDKASCPYAVLGDFNASPAWPLYRQMAARHQDAALLAQSTVKATWPAISQWGFSGLFRIDHCFLHRLGIASFRTVALPGSDHSGLLVDLTENSASPA